MRFTVCYCHVTCAFQSESTIYSCLNVMELLAQNRREIWSLSVWNWTRTNKHLFRNRALNHLAQLTKWLSTVVITYLYGAFDGIFLSCHVPVLEWINTLQLPQCQGIPCLEKARNLKFKRCNWTRTHNDLVHKQTLNHLAQLTKRLTSVMSPFMYGAFDCMLLSCHVRIWELIHTL